MPSNVNEMYVQQILKECSAIFEDFSKVVNFKYAQSVIVWSSSKVSSLLNLHVIKYRNDASWLYYVFIEK